MLSIIFWTSTEIFMQIGPWGEAKKAKKALITPSLHCFKATVSLNTSAAALYTYSKMTGVLEISAVTLSTFMKMTGSFKQA